MCDEADYVEAIVLVLSSGFNYSIFDVFVADEEISKFLAVVDWLRELKNVLQRNEGAESMIVRGAIVACTDGSELEQMSKYRFRQHAGFLAYYIVCYFRDGRRILPTEQRVDMTKLMFIDFDHITQEYPPELGEDFQSEMSELNFRDVVEKFSGKGLELLARSRSASVFEAEVSGVRRAIRVTVLDEDGLSRARRGDAIQRELSYVPNILFSCTINLEDSEFVRITCMELCRPLYYTTANLEDGDVMRLYLTRSKQYFHEFHRLWGVVCVDRTLSNTTIKV